MKNFIRNEKGMVLVTSYMAFMVLLILGSSFLASSLSEIRGTERFIDSSRAFWAAEKGLAEVIYNLNNGIPLTQDTFINVEDFPIYYDSGYSKYKVESYDTFTSKVITITGIAGAGTDSEKVEKKVQIRLTRKVFENTISVGGNFEVFGLLADLDVFGKTRISGTYSKSGLGASTWFEDKQEGVSSEETTIQIPDIDDNGTPGEFNDFVTHFDAVVDAIRTRTLLEKGDADAEAILIETDGDYYIYPQVTLVDKDIVYVRGSGPGQGNVYVVFDATWEENQDLTIISTGTVTYLEPLQYESQNSRLNFVSWGDYIETAFLERSADSAHESVIYAQEDVDFVDFFATSSSKGNIIAKGDVTFAQIFAVRDVEFSSRVADGDIPPGFGSLKSSDLGVAALNMSPQGWKEDIE